MKHFINLTKCVINKLHIVEITKDIGKYKIFMSNNTIDGTFIFSSGGLSTNFNIIEICENENAKDYKTITNLIEKIEDSYGDIPRTPPLAKQS